jgi:hypothetical protein
LLSFRGLFRAGRRVGLALTLALVGYVGLVACGALPSPFAPGVGGDIALARSGRPGLRVLFVGNSFTYANDMPGIVRELAAAARGGPAMFAVDYTAPGWTLRRASEDDGLKDLLAEVDWDVVVLQEQSWLPSSSRGRRNEETVPFARALARKIARSGATTLLFMTWGYEHGDPKRDGDTFGAMQARVERSYRELGADLGARVAPVGHAWAEALRRRPELDLWQSDGRHPNRQGSYLAACVLYAVVSGRDPSARASTAGLDAADAAFLRRVAAAVVREERLARGR